MMNCAEYRRTLLAEPRRPDPVGLAHAATCDECSRYTERLLKFEDRLERALRVDVAPPGTAGSPSAVVLPFAARARGASSVPPRPARRRAWAIAASVLLGAFLGTSLWLGAPGSSLAADVVGHMAGEPAAWARTDLASPHLDQVLRAAHVILKPSAGLVSYASSCLFRGHTVPHLVVQTATGPVTVMVLPHESVWRSMRFDEHGYRGMIVPVPGHGSLAVLEKAPDTDMKTVEDVAARVRGAIEWTG